MGMAAGVAFFALRALFALIPAIALNRPTKKWAAAGALGVVFVYMLLSGATVSSRRAFVMIGLVLLAILVDRVSVSARAIAFAAVIVMLMTPDAATGPSFQMSFAVRILHHRLLRDDAAAAQRLASRCRCAASLRALCARPCFHDDRDDARNRAFHRLSLQSVPTLFGGRQCDRRADRRLLGNALGDRRVPDDAASASRSWRWCRCHGASMRSRGSAIR